MTMIQVVLLSLLAGISIIDALSTSFGLGVPVVAGMLAGLIMGDMTTGLFIGGTLQLMILGIGTFGGASIPNYVVGAIVGTAFAANGKMAPELAITTIAVPVGLLMVQLDILARSANIYFARRAEYASQKLQFNKMNTNVLLGSLPWALSRAIPVFLVLAIGQTFVEELINVMPAGLLMGLKVTGGLLPIVGIAILLRFMNTRAYFPYLLIGFVFATYLGTPMLGVAIIGLALGLINFKRRLESTPATAMQGGTDYDE